MEYQQLLPGEEDSIYSILYSTLGGVKYSISSILYSTLGGVKYIFWLLSSMKINVLKIVTFQFMWQSAKMKIHEMFSMKHVPLYTDSTVILPHLLSGGLL